jgi:hypothetical protein
MSMTAIRKRLSYANVMATLAVFISLGGGAFAALRLPANSVGTKQLKRSAVTGAKVKDASLTGKDVKPGSLPGEDIKPGTLSAASLPLIPLERLLGFSGTATNSTEIELKEGACERYVFTAPGAQPGDAVILQGSDVSGLKNAIEGGATVTNPNQMNVSVCAGSKQPTVNQAVGAVQLRFDTLR